MASTDTLTSSAALAANDLAHQALADIGRSLQRASALLERAAAAQSQISEMLTALVVPHRWVGTRLDIAGPDGWTIGPDLQGRPGAGTPGKSAYQLWLDEGNSGTIGDYLEAQRGESFRPNAVGAGSFRSQFDDQRKGFAYLAADEERLYFRVGDEPGVWSDPVTFGRGESGRTPELDATEEHIRWRPEGDEVWRTLVSLQSLKGKDGREVEIRATSTHLQWRYAGGPWADMVLIADLQAAATAAVDEIVYARESALGAIVAAAGPVAAAVEAAEAAAGIAGNAASAAGSARLWADAPPDTLVDDGVNPPGYSARHWSSKAAEAVDFDPDLYLTRASNLAGLADKAAARRNLDLGGAATEEATAFATAAQGDLAATALQPDALAAYTPTDDLPAVARSGRYADLEGAPDIPAGTVTSVGLSVPAGFGVTGAVTTSGTITLTWAEGFQGYTAAEALKLAGLSAQVQADWTATSGLAAILNLPGTFPPAAHGHAIGDITSLQTALNAKAALASPALTGNPTAPTQAPGNASTRLANTQFVANAIAALVGAAPDLLNEIHEIAAALGNDPNFATTVTGLIAGKLSKSANLSDLTDVEAARTALELGSAALSAASAFATATQGAKADTALQSAALNAYTPTNSLPAVAQTGQYADLEGAPGLATASAVRAGANTEDALGVANTWAAHAPVAVTLTALDMATFINGTAAISANTTVANPSGVKPGQAGVITVTVSGTRTTSFAGNWKKAEDSPDPPTTGKYMISYYAESASVIVYAIAKVS